MRERTSYDLYDKDGIVEMASQAPAVQQQRTHKSSVGSVDSGGYKSSDTLQAGGECCVSI